MTETAKRHSTNEDVRTFVAETGRKLSLVIRETRRLENMVKNMVDFAHPFEIDLKVADIREVFAESLQFVVKVAGERKIKIVGLPSDGSSPVRLDVMPMKQVIINLTMNAIQASPEGETVTVCSYRNGRKLIIDVTDCGHGIPANKREEIYFQRP